MWMGFREKESRSLFHRNLRFSIWSQTYFTWHAVSNQGCRQTFMIFKSTVRVILPLVHHPRIQKSAVKGLPQSEVASKPLTVITMKNHQANPSLIYLVLVWTHLYFFLPQLPVATSSTIKLYSVRKCSFACFKSILWQFQGAAHAG